MSLIWDIGVFISSNIEYVNILIFDFLSRDVGRRRVAVRNRCRWAKNQLGSGVYNLQQSLGVGMRRVDARLILGLMILIPLGVQAGSPPQVGTAGRVAYETYLQAGNHKAFAIAPGGAWAWRAELPSAESAEKAALGDCGRQTAQRCFVYALDGQTVFHADAWKRAWGPYLDRRGAGQAAEGLKRGERFPDLRITCGDGRATKLSALRGKVVLLHFWGSWCPHCLKEMPDLQRLYGRFARSREVAFVLLPVREAFADSMGWIRQKKVRMPVYDGGPTVVKEKAFLLAGGGKLPDREVARVFPSTYVLDKHGIVLFSHTGPVSDWLEYEDFLRDAARRSGK